MLTVEQIQQHFIEQLNGAIRRPGMYGRDEDGLGNAMRNVTYVMETGDERGWINALEARGAWSSIGVTGMVRQLMPGTEQNAAASVYADYAHEHGWLVLDRTLTAEEYGVVRDRFAQWCAVDRSRGDVVERFGEPSVRTTSSGDGVLGYGRPGEPIVWFHCGDDEVVLAGRCGGLFVESLRFTPEGTRRRPAEEDDS
ncbi:hypothetical protein GCM10009745_03370 [Kribbella yunnanensis]|uniref:Uncharacterized protein n=1 Tax=Kribbella yunnanensis TaxID=190194 RepID=A0ABN2G4I2_9ACTN